MKKKEKSKEGLQGVSLKQWRQIDLSVERRARARQGEAIWLRCSVLVTNLVITLQPTCRVAHFGANCCSSQQKNQFRHLKVRGTRSTWIRPSRHSVPLTITIAGAIRAALAASPHRAHSTNAIVGTPAAAAAGRLIGSQQTCLTCQLTTSTPVWG